jgi:hypothetical protein
LLIVEQTEIGNDLADSLELLGYSVVETLTSAELPPDRSCSLEADVVLVDLEVEGEADPVAAGRLVRERWNVPVVYLANDARQAKRVIREGDDVPYVMWPFPSCALNDAIEQVLTADGLPA